MQIAIDARMYGNEQCSGIGLYIQKLTEQLFKIDQENEYIMFMREPEFSKFQLPHKRVKKISVTPRWYSYGEQFILPRQLKKAKFDLIHYPHFNSPILFPKKSVCTIHDITPLFFPGHKMTSCVRRLGYKLVLNATLRKAQKIIAVSQATKNDIIKYFKINPQKITVTHEGVDERFKIIENNDIILKTKERYGITNPYVFFVGVWRGHKNIESLIQAFNLLKEKHTIPHQLVLAGREDLHYTKVREQINQSAFKNEIITTGFIPDKDLPAIYTGADAFALPSFIEGFGLIAIEAQNCGCPVVSTDTSSMPEVLGDSALFFDPYNVAEMAEKIFQVLIDEKLKQKLIQRGLKNSKRFSWRKCAEQTLEIYKNACKKEKG